MCLRNHYTHDWIVECVKYSRSKKYNSHSHGIDAKQILEIIQDVTGREHVDHILTDCAYAIGEFFLYR